MKCCEIDPPTLKQAEEFASSTIKKQVEKGKITPENAQEIEKNLSFTSTLEEAAKDADFVIEAVNEDLALKRRLFTELDEICPPHAILTTNSSFTVSSKIADATKRPEKVCNMHFFLPVLISEVIEIVKGPHVSEETANTIVEVTQKMGKYPLVLKKEIYGFVVNRILSSITQEALYLYDMGVASHEEIDTAITKALGHPIGPFRLMDLTGFDLNYQIRMERFRETGNPADRPSPAVCEKYFKGEWGRKTGKGFYTYGEEFVTRKS